MKVRKTSLGTAGGAKLTAVSCATLTVLVSAVVSACTSSPSSTHPAIFTPTSSVSEHPSGGASKASGTPTESHSHSASASASEHPSDGTSPDRAFDHHPRVACLRRRLLPPTTYPPTTPATSYPAAPLTTGGGGTAGLQDGLLFGVGGAAMLALFRSLAYRRRVKRDK